MKIKDFLDTPEKWTKGNIAKTVEGEPASPHNPEAVCWCLSGLIVKCYSSPNEDIIPYSKFYKIRNKITEYLGVTRGSAEWIRWNDAPERTFEEVKNLVEKLDI